MTFGLDRGPYTVCRNCFLGRDLSGLAMDYTVKFFDLYPNDRKFMKVRLISAHEFTGENGWYMDVEIAKYLKQLEDKGHLEKTITLFYSDHGDHIDYFLYRTNSGAAEMVNPFFFALLPEDFAKKVHDKVSVNQQRLLTHYEIFRSVVKYLGVEFERRVAPGPSIFYDIVKEARTCKDAQVAEDCHCKLVGEGQP